MNKSLYMLMAGAMIFGAAELSAQTKNADPVQEKLKAVYSKAEQLFRSNFPGSGFASYSDDGILGAMKEYQEALKIEGLSNMQKIELHKRIANCCLEVMDVEKANAELQKAAALPGLDEKEKFAANENLADAYRRELDYEKVIPAYLNLLNGQNVSANNSVKYSEIIYNAMSRVQGKDAADKWLASRPNAAEVTAKINASSGYTAAAVKDLEEKLKNTNLKIGERGSAFSKLIEFCIEKADLQKLNEYLNTWIPVFQKESPKDLPRFLSNTCHWYTIKNLSSHPAFLEQYTTRLLEFNSGNLTFWEGKLTAQKALNDVNGQIKTVNDILNSVNLNAEKKLFYQSVKTVYDSDSGESAAKKITELVKNAEDEKLRTSKKTADLLQEAARTAMRQGKEQKARDIWNVRESMMVPNVKPSVECAFVNNAPSDITAFLASPYVKTQKNMGVLDKKYGDNLQFLLETDSAITGRTVTNDSGKNAEPTKFYTVCDEKGVKFLFIMPCDSARAKALQNGYGGFGGFEMYFTTGYDQPYDCLLIDCPPNVSVGDNFITQYDNMGFRRACRENDNLNVSFRIDDDKVLMLLEIDWRAAVNGIPSNGFRWELEPIHWERGGWDWGGSKSVHNRSSFGDVVFANMTPENAAKIKRRLLSYAAKAYNAELTSRQRGELEVWMDPELGDRKFYLEVVEPFKKKYGAYVGAIKPDMPDAEVNRIYDEAYLTLINTKYVIQKLRREYLAKRFVEE